MRTSTRWFLCWCFIQATILSLGLVTNRPDHFCFTPFSNGCGTPYSCTSVTYSFPTGATAIRKQGFGIQFGVCVSQPGSVCPEDNAKRCYQELYFVDTGCSISCDALVKTTTGC